MAEAKEEEEEDAYASAVDDGASQGGGRGNVLHPSHTFAWPSLGKGSGRAPHQGCSSSAAAIALFPMRRLPARPPLGVPPATTTTRTPLPLFVEFVGAPTMGWLSTAPNGFDTSKERDKDGDRERPGCGT